MPTANYPTGGSLTPRETEIARLVAKGMRNGAIADELQIEVVTVKNHLQRIMRKLDAKSRMDVMLFCLTRQSIAERSAEGGLS